MTDVTVIVCTYNEAENISLLLEALNSQTYKSFRLIVADDGSTDATASIISKFIEQRCNMAVSYIQGAHIGKEQTFKAVIASIENENTLILTTDADCRPSEKWVEYMVETFEKRGAEMLIGPVAIERSHPLQATEFLSIEAVTLFSASIGHPVLCGGANLGFLLKSYREVSGLMPSEFDNGGDIYLLEAMKKAKKTISPVVSPTATVWTKGVSSLKKFLNQRARWAGKAHRYRDWEIIVTGGVTALLQLAAVASLFIAPLYPLILYLWPVKLIVDFIILTITAIKQHREGLIPYILPVSIIYPFYVTATLIISIFKR